MRTDSIGIIPLNTNLNNTNILPKDQNTKEKHSQDIKIEKKKHAAANNTDCYNLDVTIKELPSSPLAVTGTISVCGDTCVQSRCTNYTCDGGSHC